MTHEELLAKIRTGNEFLGVKYAPDSHTFALRAVVGLHHPRKKSLSGDCNECLNYYDSAPYPCPTIQAIEKELA